MKLALTAHDILQIAERVELKVTEFYEGAQHLFQDGALAQACRELAARSQHQRILWGNQCHTFEQQSLSATDLREGENGLMGAAAMAGLTWFGQRRNSPAKLQGITDRRSLLLSAAKRSRDLEGFYRGLNGFALDEASERMIDGTIAVQTEHQQFVAGLCNRQKVFPSVDTKAVA